MSPRAILTALLLLAPAGASAQPPLDLWTPAVMQRIRDRATLSPQVVTQVGYFEVYYNSEVAEAKWADAGPPYEVHTGDTIRIHGYLASPLIGGPYPAIVIGHGHGGRGSRELALALAARGYVALSIDGPRAGGSTGGPQDKEQAWISVEEVINQPSPEVSYLYHYAYAGMRGLTLLDHLSRLFLNPFRIDRTRMGVIGASMGGQFAYYINGVDDRVKGAVAIAAAGDWHHQLFYEGAWLYHGLYYYTRDGLPSGWDALNAVSNVCTDPTIATFLDYFDPIQYAPRQHGPILSMMGTHDQYFTIPAINTTFDRTASAGTNARFLKRIMLAPNGKHAVVDSSNPVPPFLGVVRNIDGWFRYSFHNGPAPPATPALAMEVVDGQMRFRATAAPGGQPLRHARLHYATQVDSEPLFACDFATASMAWTGTEYVASVPIGTGLPCGPAATPDNVLYFVTVEDQADYTVTSKLHYRSGEMQWGSGFVPRIEHFPGDEYPVPPPPAPCPVQQRP